MNNKKTKEKVIYIYIYIYMITINIQKIYDYTINYWEMLKLIINDIIIIYQELQT